MAPMTGHGDSTSVDLTEALARLCTDRDAIPWPERRQIVARIVGPLTEGLAGDPFRSLLLLLAEDPKWEVRKDVADALATIPDNDLAVLADKFLTDTHAYVRRAAKQSITRRRQTAREAQKRKRGVDLVLALYQDLEDLKSSVRKANPAIVDFEASCFDGIYITGDITPAYLDKIERGRAGGKANKAVDDDQMELELAMSASSM